MLYLHEDVQWVYALRYGQRNSLYIKHDDQVVMIFYTPKGRSAQLSWFNPIIYQTCCKVVWISKRQWVDVQLEYENTL